MSCKSDSKKQMQQIPDALEVFQHFYVKKDELTNHTKPKEKKKKKKERMNARKKERNKGRTDERKKSIYSCTSFFKHKSR